MMLLLSQRPRALQKASLRQQRGFLVSALVER